jgi:hypothetical protein
MTGVQMALWFSSKKNKEQAILSHFGKLILPRRNRQTTKLSARLEVVGDAGICEWRQKKIVLNAKKVITEGIVTIFKCSRIRTHDL